MGWNISFLVGGPAPHQNGKILTYMYDIRSPWSRFTLLMAILEGCIAESHPTAKTSKGFLGKMDTTNILLRLSMISFRNRFVSRAEFER
jgi:hypothetical protein